jgi:hypothetical protein
MFDYVIQNFNLVSFSLALSFFLIVSAVGRLATSFVTMNAARRRAKAAKAKLEEMQQKLLGDLKGVREGLKEVTKDAGSRKSS